MKGTYFGALNHSNCALASSAATCVFGRVRIINASKHFHIVYVEQEIRGCMSSHNTYTRSTNVEPKHDTITKSMCATTKASRMFQAFICDRLSSKFIFQLTYRPEKIECTRGTTAFVLLSSYHRSSFKHNFCTQQFGRCIGWCCSRGCAVRNANEMRKVLGHCVEAAQECCRHYVSHNAQGMA